METSTLFVDCISSAGRVLTVFTLFALSILILSTAGNKALNYRKTLSKLNLKFNFNILSTSILKIYEKTEPLCALCVHSDPNKSFFNSMLYSPLPINGKNQPISLSKVADIFCRLLVLLETSGRLLMSLATMIKKFQIFNFVNFSSFCLKFPSCHFNICFTENLLFTLTSCSRQMEKKFCNFLCSGIQAFC